MNILIRRHATSLIVLIVAIFFLTLLIIVGISNIAHAGDSYGTNGRLITIHDRDSEKIILTHANTIGEAIKAAGIPIDKNDLIEPDVNQKLIASNYQVNIYRARPILIIDGNIREKIITPYQTPLQIAASAGIVVYPEDITTIDRVDNLVDGAGLQMTINRAIPFNFTLYGKTTIARTQATTIGGMLSEKRIKLTKDDRVEPSLDTKITNGLSVKVWREGKQTVTIEEAIYFEIEKIQDADRQVGYLDITTPGVKGLRNVTYEIVVRDGKEISRKEIASLTIKQPVKQIEIVGAKLAFNGNFAAALAKLRSCEGGYNSWNPSGPYYGAYQFDQQTWGTVANPSDYGSAPPAEQDNAAYQLYLRRGWSPWPVCGAAVLPDIYR